VTKSSDFSNEIKFAAKAGFLSRGLWDEFFAHGKIAWRNRQWRMMKEKGLFKQFNSGLAPKFYILNPKSVAVNSTLGDQVGRPPPIANLGHDEILIGGLMRLKCNGVIHQFTLERELKRNFQPGISSNDKYPDALISTSSGQKFAVELELGRKSLKRYSDILLRYCFQEDLDGVIYVCDADVFEAIEQAKVQTKASSLNLIRIALEDWDGPGLELSRSFGHSIRTVSAR
jgi:hypothetical protein